MVTESPELPRRLGDGLVLRRATTDDVVAVAEFNSTQHPTENAPAGVSESLAGWTRDLMEGAHPTVRASDCTVVEDTRLNRIASSTILISQTWTYDGLPFGVGRPELVATHPDYRNRGLIRAQFEVLHQWSAERGHMAQAITGIPWFYRQFGYEMCVDLDSGRLAFRRSIPVLKAGEPEPYRLRPATERDVDCIGSLYRAGAARSLLSAVRDRSLWEYEISGRRTGSMPRMGLRIIETPSGGVAGFIAVSEYVHHGMLAVSAFELLPEVPWQGAAASVLRAVMAEADDRAAKREEDKPEGVRCYLENEHPAFRTTAAAFPESFGPYAYYMRVPDVPAFLTLIRSVLDKRLAGSPFAAFSGDVSLNFYRGGLKLKIVDGHVVDVQPWQPSSCHSGDAQYPDLTFLSVLFGHRSTKELNATRPDCFASHSAEPLLDTLFPRRQSCVWPVA